MSHAYTLNNFHKKKKKKKKNMLIISKFGSKKNFSLSWVRTLLLT